MKKIKLMMFLSILNIAMFHFNISWTDLFKPINAYENTGNLIGTLLGRVIVGQLEDNIEDIRLKRSLSLQNKETGEVITIGPGTMVRINLEETDYTFKKYSSEENAIYVKEGSIDLKTSFDNLSYISIVFDPKVSPAAIGAAVLGGAVGFGLGWAAEEASNPQYMTTGGGGMMGCTLGMLAGPVYTAYYEERKTIDFSLADWEVY